MANTSVKMINLYNKVKDKPELLQLLESAKELKKNEIDNILEVIEKVIDRESVDLKNGRKTKYRVFRRIDADWNKLNEDIKSKGYSYVALSEKIGISNAVLYNSKREGKINPFLLEEICSLLNLKAEDYCEELKYIRLRNGRSTLGKAKAEVKREMINSVNDIYK